MAWELFFVIRRSSEGEIFQSRPKRAEGASGAESGKSIPVGTRVCLNSMARHGWREGKDRGREGGKGRYFSWK